MTARFAQALASLPHGPGLRLLDEIVSSDAVRLTACSTRHRRPAHPLAGADGLLPASSVLELAAQAAAVHIALGSAAGTAARGVVALLREMELGCAVIATTLPPLWITVDRRTTIPGGFAYGFLLQAGDSLHAAQAAPTFAHGVFGVVITASTTDRTERLE